MENTANKTPDETGSTPQKILKTTTITLPSGKVAVVNEFKGKDIRRAQQIAGDDSSLTIFALISQTTSIDEKFVTAEEIDEMDGMDVMELMTAFGKNFTPRQSK